MPDFITRFAPSPTGQLHIGHAFSALCAFEGAKNKGGSCLLRIEDTDTTRCRPAFEQSIYDDLKWLGFSWPEPVRRQSLYLNEYQSCLEKLQSLGLVYRCFKTRREIMDQIALAPHAEDLAASREEAVFSSAPLPIAKEKQLLDQNKPYAWRLSLQACKSHLGAEWGELSFLEEQYDQPQNQKRIKATPAIFGDVILARKDTGTSYHLACVHDDARQDITHVIRGQDLFEVTHLHVLLQNVLALPTPIYRHHPLLLDEQGKRFAKRDKAKTLLSMREEGLTPDDVYLRIEKHLQHLKCKF